MKNLTLPSTAWPWDLGLWSSTDCQGWPNFPWLWADFHLRGKGSGWLGFVSVPFTLSSDLVLILMFPVLQGGLMQRFFRVGKITAEWLVSFSWGLCYSSSVSFAHFFFTLGKKMPNLGLVLRWLFFSAMVFLKIQWSALRWDYSCRPRTSEVIRTWSLAEFMNHPWARLVSTKQLLK